MNMHLTQTIAEVMDPGVVVVHNRLSIETALELANGQHLIVVQGERPVGVLTRDMQSLLLHRSGLLNQLVYLTPLLARSETDLLSFYRDYRANLTPVVVVDAQGAIAGIVDQDQLITQLLKILEEREAFFDTLLETVNEAVTVVTNNGRVSHWNSAAQEMYSIPTTAIIGGQISEFFEREALTTLKMLDEGRPVRQAYHRPRSGTHVLINASPVLHNGIVVGAISSEQNVTQIVRLNEELTNTSSQLRDLAQKISPSADPFNRIVGRGESIIQAVELARKVAASQATVLITGESGVGKELFANAIHSASPRADMPFIPINCGAIPTPLFESELFGYQGGAFTGAERKGKPGKLELAHGGTLFLDEVGELPLELQVKLLRVLQDQCFYRVGGTEPITVNTRIITATNRNLEQMISLGEFREDLYYRLNVIALDVPPLRQRPEDIPVLVQMFLQEFAFKYNKPIPILDPETMVSFLHYPWPGNIRELRNMTERLAILSEDQPITPLLLPITLQRYNRIPLASTSTKPFSRVVADNSSDELKRISAALDRTFGNKSAAAKLLGISRGTLYYKLKHYGLA
jgi:sigma-54 dependent transcriptional regulator, acetoin dehydrogenase operon transcriptional activator AcoR